MTHHQPKDYALVVGIDTYPNYGSQGRNLKGAVRDAERFYDWLVDQNTGGGLDPGHCELVTSKGNPMALTNTTIDLALKALWEKALEDGGGRRFYFFLSGHGQLVLGADMVSYDQSLCLPQWSYMMPNAALNADNYRDVVGTCMPFDEVVMFLDCCRVPAVKVRPINSMVGCSKPREGFETVNHVAYFAAEPMRRAFEDEVAGESEDAGPEVHGYFTTALLDALKVGSDRAGGGIDAKALGEYLELRVPQLADENGRHQIPRHYPPKLTDDIVFGAAGPGHTAAAPPPGQAAANFQIRFGAARVGPIRLVDSDDKTVREGPPASGPWHVRLNLGETYMLVDEHDDQQRAFIFLPAMEGRHDVF